MTKFKIQVRGAVNVANTINHGNNNVEKRKLLIGPAKGMLGGGRVGNET